MSVWPSYFPELSVYLSRVLDELPVNELIVQDQRTTALQAEHLASFLANYVSSLWFKDMPSVRRYTAAIPRTVGICSCYVFGSQSEGTCTVGLNSDIDMLICHNTINVIQDFADWEQGEINMLVLFDDTCSGYCRLQRLQDNEPLPMEYLPDEDYIYDQCNRVILKNTCVHNTLSFTEQNGPAETYTEKYFPITRDIVRAYRCKTWPTQAYRFTRRQRHGHWPSPEIIKQGMTDGVFLVPVGCKLSPTEHLEWRISFSLTERRLMFSLNMTQIKCYVILKMLMKTFITPYVGESISSYHCKTALFYCIEALGYQYWSETNLVQGIVRCLEVLLTWVRNEFCPHFIIPESNLFKGKITETNKHGLQFILKELIASKGRFLLCISTDDLGQNLQMKISTLPSCDSIVDSPGSEEIVALNECSWLFATGSMKCALLYLHTLQDRISVIQQHHKQIRMLCSHLLQPETYRTKTIHSLIQHFSFRVGSLLTSESLSRRGGVPKEALKWFSLSATSDISSMLKLASMYFSSGDMPKTETILLDVADRYLKNNVQSVCTCYGIIPLEFYDTIKDQLDHGVGTSEEASPFDDCVRFSPHERPCVPPALQFEFNRSTGDDILHRHQLFDLWMDLAVADSFPYLYYLQYCTYGQMGKRDLQNVALHSLEKSLVEDRCYGHLETDWSLLGQCMEQEGDFEMAMGCYRTSLEIKPRNNAANQHLRNLVDNKDHCISSKTVTLCDNAKLNRSIISSG